MEIELSDLKVGDHVYSSRKGIGFVVDLGINLNYPVQIKFKLSSEFFTYLGKLFFDDIHPACFHSLEEMQQYFAEIEPPLPDLKTDDKVWIYKSTWIPAHFHSWEGHNMKYFADGKTSHTNYDQVGNAPAWSLTAPPVDKLDD